MALREFINDLEKKDSNIRKYFSDPELLTASLIEMDEVIGMAKVKLQILKQIKTFIVAKKKKTYRDSDRKHCLLCGPPGCGKTTIGLILCKIWIGIGFIGSGGKLNKKVNSFNKVQDELIRHQRQEIREYKDKIRSCVLLVNNMTRSVVVNKKAINTLIRLKGQIPPNENVNELIRDLSSSNNIVEHNGKLLRKLADNKQQTFRGFGIEQDKSLASTRSNEDLPFFVYKRNDVVSRYVGDTAHRCTKAMEEALDGVAYFDEAYNLCNNDGGFGDQYGKEALTTINQYMDEQSDKLIVVFAGYKDDIYRNLFATQQGLESRFTNKFEIENYTYQELTKIYIQRLKKGEWIIAETQELINLIKVNFDLFKFQGRDMDTLAGYTKDAQSDLLYESAIEDEEFSNIITNMDIVRKAIEQFKANKITVSDNSGRSLRDLIGEIRA